MQHNKKIWFLAGAWIVMLVACTKNADETTDAEKYPAVKAAFGSNIDLGNLENYANQATPAYITKVNGGNNPITNAGATLGRVLFYDKQLSVNNTIACASCHRQSLAFSDDKLASQGVNGNTGRHSMRLVNARFGAEVRFFWDERAVSLEDQTTRPIKDHTEMGWSGQSGNPDFNALITKLSNITYYRELFTFVYGDATITEARIQTALAQFVRSIQSFDSKFDVGRAQVGNDGQPFPNFTAQENQGKNIFLSPPQFNPNGVRIGGGAGCGGCHRAPEFDIDPNSRNNGIITGIGGVTELNITRSPSLRDVVKADGSANGQMMHNALADVGAVLIHYNSINPAGNTNLDPRLRPAGNGQQLQLTQAERDALLAFVRTLAGTQVYVNKKWANPFLP